MATKNKKSQWNIDISFGGIKIVDILMFTKHLSVTLKSGLTIIDGLEILRDQAKGKLAKVLGRIYEKVTAGGSFHDALAEYPQYFSPIYTNMVKIGESSGTLEESLQRLAIEMDKAYKLRKKVKSAMIYPVFVFIAVAGLGLSVAYFVLPKILPLFKSLNVELPLLTRGLIYIAEMFDQYGLLIMLVSIIGSVAIFWFLKRKFMRPVTHRAMLAIPVLKDVVSHINLERFNRTLGILLQSGLTIDHALTITSKSVDNLIFQRAVADLVPQIKSGKTLEMALQKYKKLFPLITSRMVAVGENTGNMDQTLLYLADFYEELVDESTKNLSTMLEPILLISIGIIVAMVAMAILGPIYEITGNLR